MQFIKEDLDRCNKILGAKPSERLEYWRGQEIKRFLKWVSDYTNCKRLQDIDRRTAQSYALYVGKGKSSKTVQEIIGCLLAIWNTLARGHDNLENPWKLAMPKYVEKNRREEFTREEVGRIVKVADEVKGGWEIACRIALCTGLRFGDIVNLEYSNIRNGCISIKPSKTSAHDIGVDILLPKSLLEMIGNGEGHIMPKLFPGAKGKMGKNSKVFLLKVNATW